MTAERPRWTDYMPLESLLEAKRNPKTHSADVGGAIARFGYADGVILDERTGRLVAGHGRRGQLLAMRERGEAAPDGIVVDDAGEWLVPVQRGWSSRSDAEADAFLLAHNKLTEAGGWDGDELAKLLAELGELDVDLEGLGFTEAELKALETAAQGGGSDDTPDPGPGEAPEDPVSQAGEVYMLGPHRLVCGDSTDPETWRQLFGQDEAARMVWTDPPYGVAYADKNEFLNQHDKGNRNQREIAGDHETPDQVQERTRGALEHIPAEPGACIYAASATGRSLKRAVEDGCCEAGWEIRWELAWVKNNHVLGRADYMGKFEPIHYGWRKDGPHLFLGHHRQSTFHVDKPLRSTEHPTMKPVELIEPMILNSANPGEIVADPFLGSGSTLIAAARTGRRCFGVELEPAYCDVIRKRWGEWARAAGKDPGPDAL